MMNDIEMPLIEPQGNIDNETVKYSQKICLYMLLFCIVMIIIMIVCEYIFGKGETIDIIAKIVTGVSITICIILTSILLYIVYY